MFFKNLLDSVGAKDRQPQDGPLCQEDDFELGH